MVAVPSDPLVDSRVAWVASFLTVIFAPGTAEPFGSTTVSMIAPVFGDWAIAIAADKNMKLSAPNPARLNLHKIIDLRGNTKLKRNLNRTANLLPAVVPFLSQRREYGFGNLVDNLEKTAVRSERSDRPDRE